MACAHPMALHIVYYFKKGQKFSELRWKLYIAIINIISVNICGGNICFTPLSLTFVCQLCNKK